MVSSSNGIFKSSLFLTIAANLGSNKSADKILPTITMKQLNWRARETKLSEERPLFPANWLHTHACTYLRA